MIAAREEIAKVQGSKESQATALVGWVTKDGNYYWLNLHDHRVDLLYFYFVDESNVDLCYLFV